MSNSFLDTEVVLELEGRMHLCLPGCPRSLHGISSNANSLPFVLTDSFEVNFRPHLKSWYVS